MNNPLIISKTCVRECSDATCDYDLQIRPDTTLSEFVNSILSDTTEWGCITVRKGGRPDLGIEGRLIMDIWYRHGGIGDINTYGNSSITFDNIRSRHIYEECKANGGWTRMDYTVTLKEETNE
jgi:hypothetical protein